MDLREALREASFLVEVSRADIAFERDFGIEPLMGTFDSRLMAQAFGNVIKNAAEAIEASEREIGRSRRHPHRRPARPATHPRRRASTTARGCRARIASGCSSPI